MTRDCALCGRPLPQKGARIAFTYGKHGVHGNRRYCSAKCRQKAYRLRGPDVVTEVSGDCVTDPSENDGSSSTQEALNTGSDAVLVPVDRCTVPAPARSRRP